MALARKIMLELELELGLGLRLELALLPNPDEASRVLGPVVGLGPEASPSHQL